MKGNVKESLLYTRKKKRSKSTGFGSLGSL